jgi:hypothetical protein
VRVDVRLLLEYQSLQSLDVVGKITRVSHVIECSSGWLICARRSRITPRFAVARNAPVFASRSLRATSTTARS